MVKVAVYFLQSKRAISTREQLDLSGHQNRRALSKLRVTTSNSQEGLSNLRDAIKRIGDNRLHEGLPDCKLKPNQVPTPYFLLLIAIVRFCPSLSRRTAAACATTPPSRCVRHDTAQPLPRPTMHLQAVCRGVTANPPPGRPLKFRPGRQSLFLRFMSRHG